MNNIPYEFQNPAFAETKFLDKFAPIKQHGENCDAIEKNPHRDIMSNITTIPSLHKVLQEPESSNIELKSISTNSYKRAYEKYLNSDSGRETLSKAVKYNIPFDGQDIDFLNLIHKIAEYECLLEKA